MPDSSFLPGLAVIAAILYFTGGAMLSRRLFGSTPAVAPVFSIEMAVAFIAMIIQGILLYLIIIARPGLSLSLVQAASFASWMTVLLFLLLVIWKRLKTLGVFVLPLAGFCVLLTAIWSEPAGSQGGQSTMATLHLLVALLAYGFLALAVAQAMLLQIQENQLRHGRPGHKLGTMPAVETMENTMFTLIVIGFLLLTIALASGAFFSEQMYGRALVFNHHIVLSICAWLSFGTLLVGRFVRGWRGQRATLWTCFGFGLLVLAYFGTRLVLEVILGRNA